MMNFEQWTKAHDVDREAAPKRTDVIVRKYLVLNVETVRFQQVVQFMTAYDSFL